MVIKKPRSLAIQVEQWVSCVFCVSVWVSWQNSLSTGLRICHAGLPLTPRSSLKVECQRSCSLWSQENNAAEVVVTARNEGFSSRASLLVMWFICCVSLCFFCCLLLLWVWLFWGGNDVWCVEWDINSAQWLGDLIAYLRERERELPANYYWWAVECLLTLSSVASLIQLGVVITATELTDWLTDRALLSSVSVITSVSHVDCGAIGMFVISVCVCDNSNFQRKWPLT